MKVLQAESITKSYGEKTLFQDISFTIAEKQRVGLIGINGTGKSSLLKLVADIDMPDIGTFLTPKEYSLAYLDQDPVLNQNLTVLQQVFQSDATIVVLMRSYEEALQNLEKDPSNDTYQQRLFQVQKEMDQNQAWEASATVKTILTKLGIQYFDQKISELSGGQKKRVALAQVLVEKPDLLILDEPTNHLDYESIDWLQEFLGKYPGSVLFVTHDRYFLDKVANQIFELDKGSLYTYKGNYEAFMEAKSVREENEMATREKEKNLYRRELEWMRRGAKARTTKQKARIQRFEHLDSTLASYSTETEMDMALKGSRLGKKVFELKEVSKTFHNQVILDSFSFLFKRQDRIGIVGNNGSGKSTFLNILAGLEAIDSGEVDRGQTVKIAYYTQQLDEMPPNKRMIDYIREEAEIVTLSSGDQLSVSSMLERFLFPLSTHGTPIRKLSGGEKRRLYLLKLLMQNPNVLLLDEPTNDLDTQTLTVLEAYLEEFPGVVITVSHDRYFLDKIAKQLLVFEGNAKIGLYYGTYSVYVEFEQGAKQTSEKQKIISKVPQATNEQTVKKKKMTYKEKIEWETIDEIIETTETRIEEVQMQLEKVGSDFEQAQSCMNEIEELNDKLETLIERWSYLSELSTS
ncbi:ABC-F family ATP-binding cassette domain-containing protein [Bacillus sp. 2205SS5-2]|uniref:ABC-F family ATP-binding cassette domain-containing protein n=1 Tax=Bacillus sp. 2205SS5-2 TaxID=3109031 RepID=UPI0030057418